MKVISDQNLRNRTRGTHMTIMNFLSDIRNAAIANAVIVVFHVYIAFAVEGLDFLIIVIPVGALIAGAYYFKGKIGAILLALPTLGYLLIVPDLIDGLVNGTSGGDNHIEWGIYILAPFWLFTILLNFMSIIAEVRGTNKT